MPSRFLLCAALLVCSIVACSSDAEDRAAIDSANARNARNNPASGVAFSARDSARELGPGDVIITDRDSSIELALIGDHVASRFSAKTMAKIKAETDTSKLEKTGFAAAIERSVKSTVQSALSKEIRYPISDIREARYDGGRIILEEKNGKNASLLGNTKVNNRRVDESFAPDDAQRFVDAVNARIKAQSH